MHLARVLFPAQRRCAPLCLLVLLLAADAPGQTAQTFSQSGLYNFVCSSTSCPAGAEPLGNLLLASDGNFYGVSSTGWGNSGVIFKITPSGTFSTLHTFCANSSSCPDGANPGGSLIQGADGNFYGTTIGGGTGNAANCTANGSTGCGTVFKITPSGTLTTLYNFCTQGGPGCSDGFNPESALVQASDGNFYGSTYSGACSGSGQQCGSLFKITPSGTLTTIFAFTHTSDGANPVSALTLGPDGSLYGSTSGGGTQLVTVGPGSTAIVAGGVLFKVSTSGAYSALYSFCNTSSQGVCTDGRDPGALVLGPDGNFYGTTLYGGAADNGVFFQLTPSGRFTLLHSFCNPGSNTCADGSIPNDLTLASDGNFYTTVFAGGANQGGTFVRITPSGAVATLYAFCSQGGANCSDGANPNDLIQGPDGNFYGTTYTGGTPSSCSGSQNNTGCGTILKFTASPAEPFITSGAVSNGATYISGGLVPGSWAQLKGTDLATTTRVWAGADFAGLGNALPTTLSGTQVMVNHTAAAVYYISPGQISFQVPAGVSGNVSVQVINNGVASNTLTASAAASSPGIFPVIVNGINYPAGVFVNGQYVGDPSVSPAFRNAKAGDAIQLFATGLTSTPAGVLPTAQSVSGVTVTIGTTVIPADFAGLVATGEFQVNFTVPQSFATQTPGLYPISLQVGGVSSPVTVNSSPPGPLVIPVTH